MTRSMLRGIRVSSKEELKEQDQATILLAALNETPTIFKWKYKMDKMAGELSSITIVEYRYFNLES